jgi:hypothetical protein
MSHMLPHPFADMPVSSADVRLILTEVEQRERKASGATLHTTITHLLQLVLVGMAGRARGPQAAQATEYIVGTGLFAHDLAIRAIEDIETDDLIPLCNLGEGTDAIYEEVAAFGRRVLDEGTLGEDGILRI